MRVDTMLAIDGLRLDYDLGADVYQALKGVDLAIADYCDDRAFKLLCRLDSRAQDSVWSVGPAVAERLGQHGVLM